jgi:hypothetical protein
VTPEHFLAQIRRNRFNAALIARLGQLGLPDAWLVAGCLFQTVWNLRAGRPPEMDIADYDIFYFDPSDLSWEAEDAQIRRVTAALDLPVRVEIKNQARVHLWYAARFGPGYPALASSQDGIDRFLVDCTRVGVNADGGLYAPGGLDDLAEGVLRPNRLNLRPALYAAKAETYRARWPWLTVMPDSG